jgi:hypothetical protein
VEFVRGRLRLWQVIIIYSRVRALTKYNRNHTLTPEQTNASSVTVTVTATATAMYVVWVSTNVSSLKEQGHSNHLIHNLVEEHNTVKELHLHLPSNNFICVCGDV